MHKQDMLALYRYNAWSTARIMEAASHITPEQFVAPAPFPHGSLRGTLVHALFAEWLWLHRWEGIPTESPPIPEDFPTPAALRDRWAYEGTKLMAFVDGVTDEALYRPFHYVSTEGFPHDRLLWEAMAHVITHGMQHKTEAAAILTGLGHSPGDIDLIVYLNGGV